jgi:hypothetical protein
MSFQDWVEVLTTSDSNGTAVTATTAATLLPPDNRYTLPAGFFQLGRKLRITATGQMSNIITTPGTLTLDVRMGPSSNIIVQTSQAIQLNAVAKTNVVWRYEMILGCRTTGSGTTATLMSFGYFASESVVGAGTGAVGSTGNGFICIPASAPVVGTGFDSTVAMVVDVFAKFSLTGNSIQLMQYTLESLN